MKTKKSGALLDDLIDPLGKCLTAETARRLLALKADRRLSARMDYLADRSSSGELSAEERDEYASFVSFGTFVAILKSKARQLLTASARD